jgi:transposase-like protein
MAAYRRRIRQARRMKAQGATIAQIARELNSAPERIRKWIAGK